MQRGAPLLRLFLALLFAALLPIAGLLVLLAVGEPVLARISPGTGVLLTVLLAAVWAGVLTILASRGIASDLRSMLALAERGVEDAEPGTTVAQRRLAELLDERNRQIAELAARVRIASIAEAPTAVAHRIVSTIRAVSGDQTWTLVVLETAGHGLSAGVYGDPGAPVMPVEDVHRWASVTGEPGEASRSSRHVEGPWGAFVILSVSASDELRALLLAPREGRPPPSAAELDLFSLIAQHAAATLEHALLFRHVAEQADELDRMAGIQRDFLRGVTHDLQTPLTSIRALAAELREGMTTDQARDDLAMIEQQADRLRRMVGHLLAMSRLEAGALEPRQEVFRPEAVVQRAWEALHADRPFQLEVSEPAHLVVADRDRLEQVLWAVLDNAVKYSPAGSPIEVSLASEPAGDDRETSVITVSDEGPGMSTEDRERAFEQFYRSGDARRAVPDGSGIGLYTARGLVRAMGGEIEIDSRLGQGTRIRIRLPAERAGGPDDLPYPQPRARPGAG